MTETELEYQFCFNCNDRKQCYTKPKDCTRIQEEIGLQEMTNEEWLRQASKEEMEHTLTMLIMKDRFFADKEFAYVNIRFGVHCWLKEIHQ